MNANVANAAAVTVTDGCAEPVIGLNDPDGPARVLVVNVLAPANVGAVAVAYTRSNPVPYAQLCVTVTVHGPEPDPLVSSTTGDPGAHDESAFATDTDPATPGVTVGADQPSEPTTAAGTCTCTADPDPNDNDPGARNWNLNEFPSEPATTDTGLDTGSVDTTIDPRPDPATPAPTVNALLVAVNDPLVAVSRYEPIVFTVRSSNVATPADAVRVFVPPNVTPDVAEPSAFFNATVTDAVLFATLFHRSCSVTCTDGKIASAPTLVGCTENAIDAADASPTIGAVGDELIPTNDDPLPTFVWVTNWLSVVLVDACADAYVIRKPRPELHPKVLTVIT